MTPSARLRRTAAQDAEVALLTQSRWRRGSIQGLSLSPMISRRAFLLPVAGAQGLDRRAQDRQALRHILCGSRRLVEYVGAETDEALKLCFRIRRGVFGVRVFLCGGQQVWGKQVLPRHFFAP